MNKIKYLFRRVYANLIIPIEELFPDYYIYYYIFLRVHNL